MEKRVTISNKAFADQERLLNECRLAAQKAGDVVMSHRGRDPGRKKADGSPVTVADTDSENLIHGHLGGIAPQIPMVGEESHPAVSSPLPLFWLVDPLDGTKAYIRGEDEFTINIALVEKDRPILGVVYAPAMKRAFAAAVGVGAFQGETPTVATAPIRVRPRPSQGSVALTSNFHGTADSFSVEFPQLSVAEVKPMSSSIKFCLIAAAEADFYPRRGPTMEWDTAAGQAVLEVAGGKVVSAKGGPLIYGKAGFKNEGFIASGGG